MWPYEQLWMLYSAFWFQNWNVQWLPAGGSEPLIRWTSRPPYVRDRALNYPMTKFSYLQSVSSGFKMLALVVLWVIRYLLVWFSFLHSFSFFPCSYWGDVWHILLTWRNIISNISYFKMVQHLKLSSSSLFFCCLGKCYFKWADINYFCWVVIIWTKVHSRRYDEEATSTSMPK